MRRTAASVMSPSAKGRSLSVVLAAQGDPTWRPATAPMARWARECYNSRLKVGNGTLSTDELKNLWGLSPPEKAPKKWEGLKSALDAIHLTMHRFGWKARTATKWEPDTGGEIDLELTPPKLFGQMLRETVQRYHQRVAAKSAGIENEDEAKPARICTDHIAATLRSSRKLDGLAEVFATVCGAT